MAAEQLPGQVREFARYLNGLMERLDQGGGWYAVFWQRDPDGMRACLDGWEVPPWDVVEALLQDLAAGYGDPAAAHETARARALHGASLAAFDARPGGRDALGDRLDVMLREQRYAAERQAELGRLLHSARSPEEAESIRLDLAWAHDDHGRAAARCTELRHRMERLDRRFQHTHGQGAPDFTAGPDEDVFAVRQPERGVNVRQPDGGVHTAGRPTARPSPGEGAAPGPSSPGRRSTVPERTGPRSPFVDPAVPQQRAARSPFADPASPHRPAASRRDAYAPDAQNDHDRPPARAPEPAPAAPKQRSKRRARGSARFAGMMEPEAAPIAVPEAALPAPAAQGGRTPRGARFAGAAEAPAQPSTEPLDDGARQATAETVETLIRLRSEGRSGEAHAVLVEAAYWPAGRFPLLAAELHRAGLDADWSTLLWEAASLPADRLVTAADALVAAGRTADGQQMLRQGVARPAPEIGAAVLGLAEEGRRREIDALLDAYVRVRTPEEAARSAEADPQRLVPLLLEAAQGVSDERHWDLVHALRVAGFTA